MKSRMTRRQLAAAVVASAAVQAAPQTAPTADDDLKTARDRMKATSDLLAKQQVPMSIEPAFMFKA